MVWAIDLAGNLINANCQSEPTDCQFARYGIRVCSLRNNDEQEVACPLAPFAFLVGFV